MTLILIMTMLAIPPAIDVVGAINTEFSRTAIGSSGAARYSDSVDFTDGEEAGGGSPVGDLVIGDGGFNDIIQ